MNENNTNINWYPGHMAKTKRQIKEIINQIDIVVHVLDARIPKSSYIKDIDMFTNNKKQIILLSKYDLCDIKETEKWINYYKNKGYSVLTCNLKQGNDYKKVITEVEKQMEDINKKSKEKGLLPKKAKVLIVGVSNVGKSTLINKLVNKKVSETGNKPGVTKNINTIRINEKIDLVDTPGVLWPKFDEEIVALNLSAMTIIKEEVLPLDEVAIHILKMLQNNYPDIYKKMYNLDFYDERRLIEIYEIISKHRNIPFYDDEPDYERINVLITNDIKSERISGITFDKFV